MPGTPYLSTVMCDSLLRVCLPLEPLAELVSELHIVTIGELPVISAQVEGRVVGLRADVDGVDSCDWS